MDSGFNVRGGALKKIAPSGGRCENIWGVFRVKNHDFTLTNHIFFNFRWEGAQGVRPRSQGPFISNKMAQTGTLYLK